MQKGAKVVEIRQMTDAEMEAEGWDADRIDGKPTVIVFDTGQKVYPSRDPEGNGPGAFFGIEADGTPVRLFVSEG